MNNKVLLYCIFDTLCSVNKKRKTAHFRCCLVWCDDGGGGPCCVIVSPFCHYTPELSSSPWFVNDPCSVIVPWSVLVPMLCHRLPALSSSSCSIIVLLLYHRPHALSSTPALSAPPQPLPPNPSPPNTHTHTLLSLTVTLVGLSSVFLVAVTYFEGLFSESTGPSLSC